MAKILVVDDEENICRLYKAELEDEGYEVVAAESGEQALKAFQEAYWFIIADCERNRRLQNLLFGVCIALVIHPDFPRINNDSRREIQSSSHRGLCCLC